MPYVAIAVIWIASAATVIGIAFSRALPGGLFVLLAGLIVIMATVATHNVASNNPANFTDDRN